MIEAQMSIPHLFMCPISLDLINDPVTLSTGQTYDRSSIEKWLAAGNLTCPVTMQKLHDLTMVPNHTLRHLIDQWLQMGPELDRGYLTPVDSLAVLKRDLESPEANLKSKSQTLETIQALYQESPSMKYCFLQLGFLPLVLQLVFGKVEVELSEECLKFVELGLSCLLGLLSLGEYEALNLLKEESKLESFEVLFEHGSISVKVSLCHVIEAISSSSATRDLCAMLGKRQRILHSLSLLVLHRYGASEEAGIKAVSALCTLESNRENLCQEELINGLIRYISNGDKHGRDLAPKALATIEVLLGQESVKKAVMKNPDGVKALVKMVFRVSNHHGSESAVRSLMILCTNSLQAREDVICAGALTQLLLLLQSQCSSRTKTKARMLLKLLGSRWDNEPKHL